MCVGGDVRTEQVVFPCRHRRVLVAHAVATAAPCGKRGRRRRRALALDRHATPLPQSAAAGVVQVFVTFTIMLDDYCWRNGRAG